MCTNCNNTLETQGGPRALLDRSRPVFHPRLELRRRGSSQAPGRVSGEIRHRLGYSCEANSPRIHRISLPIRVKAERGPACPYQSDSPGCPVQALLGRVFSSGEQIVVVSEIMTRFLFHRLLRLNCPLPAPCQRTPNSTRHQGAHGVNRSRPRSVTLRNRFAPRINLCQALLFGISRL
jgi:hypothetical protein